MRIYTDKQLAEIEEKGVICPECGKKNLDQGFQNIRKDYCFSCNFWTDIFLDFNKNDDVYRFVIDKHHYKTNKNKHFRKGGRDSGFGGRKFLIKINETQEIIETCNLWHQGEVPIHFLHKLPDNATFLNEAYWVKVGDTWCMNVEESNEEDDLLAEQNSEYNAMIARSIRQQQR